MKAFESFVTTRHRSPYPRAVNDSEIWKHSRRTLLIIIAKARVLFIPDENRLICTADYLKITRNYRNLDWRCSRNMTFDFRLSTFNFSFANRVDMYI